MDILLFLIALSVLVIVHELGHFIAAKKVGIKVEEFGMGLPPKIFGKKIGETEWTLNLLPIGGFVRMFGEDSGMTDKKAKELGKRAFVNKTPWQKFVVVVGGVTMNILFSILVFSVVYKITGIPEETQVVKISAVAPGSPAEKAGLVNGDQIVSIEGTEMTKSSQVTEIVRKNQGKTLAVVYKRAEELKNIMVEARSNPPAGQGAMGIAVSNVEMKQIAWWEVHKSVGAGLKESYYWAKVIFGGLGTMVGQVARGKAPDDVAGPIGMLQATSSIRQEQGMLAVIHFFGIISVNLAVVNILPIPALDGGRLIFVLYEALTKRRPNPVFESRVHSIGMAFLLGLIVLITIGDLVRIFR